VDDVEKLEKQSLAEYVAALERTIEKLDEALKRISNEKEQLFEDYIASLYRIHKIENRNKGA
jgi:predicted nuclease with TOPRIM domain